MKAITKLALTATTGLVLSACQTSQDIGSGPLTLSPQVQKYFEQYLDSNPGSFVVTEDGKAFWYTYCTDSHCRDSSAFETVRKCRYKYGETCKIYAIGKEIVWQFDKKPTNTDSLSGKSPDENRSRKRHVLSAHWDDMMDGQTATMFFQTPYSGTINLMSKETARCSGKFKVWEQAQDGYHNGDWSFSCENGQGAVGKITIKVKESGFVDVVKATGLDKSKKHINIVTP